MARPSKSANSYTGKIGKENISARKEQEDALKGSSELSPPSYLNKKQKQLFNFIIQELKNANILCSLDSYILETCVIAINRLQEIEGRINKDFDLIMDSKIMGAKDKYTKDLYRCCNELSLSPQARAKLAHINVQAEKDSQDPVLQLLAGGR